MFDSNWTSGELHMYWLKFLITYVTFGVKFKGMTQTYDYKDKISYSL